MEHKSGGVLMDPSEEKIRCGHCCYRGPVDAFDACGACPGNLFCPYCSTEIEPDTGSPALLCGNCDYCEAMISDGLWIKEQLERWDKRSKELPK